MKRALTVLAVLAVCATGAMAQSWEAMTLTAGSLQSDSYWNINYEEFGDYTNWSVSPASEQSTAVFLQANAIHPEYTSDYRVRGLVSTANGTECGFIVRGNMGTLSTYAALINFGSGGFHIVKIAYGQSQGNINIEDGGIGAGFDKTGTYMLDVTVIGNQITADLIDLQGNLITRRTAVDSAYASGQYGVLAFDGALDATFTNMQIVPEPTTLVLLGVGGLMALRRRRCA